MLQFNSQGYITPTNVIEIDIVTFESVFIFNENRKAIFIEYLAFLDELKNLNLGSFYQWINGSFTTLKPNPNDIDIVTFIDFEVYFKYLAFFENKYLNRHRTKIDSYFLAAYPNEHSNYDIFKANYLDFYHNFTKDVKLERYLKVEIKSF